jgi:hypothetical protein
MQILQPDNNEFVFGKVLLFGKPFDEGGRESGSIYRLEAT